MCFIMAYFIARSLRFWTGPWRDSKPCSRHSCAPDLTQAQGLLKMRCMGGSGAGLEFKSQLCYSLAERPTVGTALSLSFSVYKMQTAAPTAARVAVRMSDTVRVTHRPCGPWRGVRPSNRSCHASLECLAGLRSLTHKTGLIVPISQGWWEIRGKMCANEPWSSRRLSLFLPRRGRGM